MAGAQETNGWGPGNQWLGTRMQMVRPQGIDRCVPAPQWDQTHPHGPLGTHGQLPYVPPPLHLVGHESYIPACYGAMHWPEPAIWIPRAWD